MEKIFDKPNFTATMLANVPYKDMERTAEVIMKYFPEAPCLPVTTRSMRWLLEGIPCLIFDREKRSVFLDPSPEREHELIEFYERYEQQDLDYFATTPKTAPFFHIMLEKLKEAHHPSLKWVAFQNVGPILLADMVKQLNGRSSFHHETLRDMLIKAINMKSRWLEKKIREELPEVEVIAGLAETTLVTYTSAGGTGTREEIIDAINGGFVGLTGLTWIHCCANIDWTLLLDSNVDVINFDAYMDSDKVALHSKECKAFLERGGMIGWGIVPVVEETLSKESVQRLLEKLEWGINLFVRKGIDEERLVSSSWVVPSCETVLLSPERSDLAFSMTREISKIMRSKYGFDA